MGAGIISPRTGRRLMSMPDVEAADMLANAAEDLLHKVFEEMLDGGEYKSPEPYWDLDLAKTVLNKSKPIPQTPRFHLSKINFAITFPLVFSRQNPQTCQTCQK